MKNKLVQAKRNNNTTLIKPRKKFQNKILALAIALISQQALVGGAYAENNSGKPMEEVVVYGQTDSLNKALLRQRNADTISNGISADSIGQLPDANVSEALQRLTGVSVERDQGEGRFVRVRGLSPDLNSVSIDGQSIPSPEAGRRAVALDVVPSELVESLVVNKTLTPDMDANTLGGSIELNSISAFDKKDFFYSVDVEDSYDDNTGESSPKFSAAASNIFELSGEKSIGIAAAASWYDRDFGSDNTETGGSWEVEDGQYLLEEFELRDYEINRERTGLALNIDYRDGDDREVYLKTLYSEFSDLETRHAAIIEFDEALPAGERGDDAEAVRELKNREETQEIISFVFGGVERSGKWTTEYSIGYSEASEDLPDGIAGAVFEANDGFNNAGFTSTKKALPIIDESFYSAETFELVEVETENTLAEDKQTSFTLDFTRETEWFGHDGKIKFGGKASQREKTNEATTWVYEDFEDAGIDAGSLSMSALSSGTVDYGLGRFGPAISNSGVRSIINGLDADYYIDDEESTINDFEIDEDTQAMYFLGQVDVDQWWFMAGVRYEAADITSKGFGYEDGEAVANKVENDYEEILPGLHARYTMDENTFVRMAWSNSLVRPTFEQLSPGFVIDGDEAEFGNPELDPLESSNFDIGIERYMGNAGIFSAYLFYKNIENFVYQTDLAGSGEYIDFDEAVTFVNGDEAEVSGIEINYSKKFDELPAPWNGMLVIANATFTDSEAEIQGFDDGDAITRDIELPSQSDTTANFVLGYETDKYSLRVAANYKSEYLLEVQDTLDSDLDLYVDEQIHVDFTARYYITPTAQVYFEANNINDEAYYVYTGRSNYNAQYEEYGPTYKLGFTISQF